MARRKELPILEKVEISDIGAEGNALARVGNMVVFVPMLVPGDIVDIRVIRKRKKYMEGSVLRFHQYSSLRSEPACSHFGICGGCKWQHLPYEYQLKYKEKQVTDNLVRIGKADLNNAAPIIGSENKYFYRNKLEFTFSDRRWLTKEEISSGEHLEKENALGFHIPGLFDKVLDIEKCHLQPEPSNAIRNAVREYSIANNISFFDLREQTGMLRNLIVRNTLSGNVMVIVVFFEDDKSKRDGLLEFISARFPEITSLMYIINQKKNDSISDQLPVLFKGEPFLTEEMEGLRFRIGAKSFYQTNTRQAGKLYSIAREFAALKGHETVYDLYTGTGTIACFVAGSAARVVGIEYVDEAVADARLNASLNKIGNAEFYAGDMKDVLSKDFFEIHGKPDVIISDPPRAGMHEDVVKAIIDASPERIVYVSCNPATQARDVFLLSESYYVAAVQPVDMFPHTHHVENVVLMLKKQD